MEVSNTVVIIGGMGAIGLNLVDTLINKGYKVHVLDNLSSSFENKGSTKFEFSYVDIFDKAKLRDIILKINPNYVFNLAAHFANQNSVDYPQQDIDTNIIGQLNVLDVCKQLNELKKYVYASSSCVYGSNALMSESDALYPHETPYAINKFVGELYTKYFATHFSLPAISVRIFNTFGKYERSGKYRNVIPNFIECALKNEPICITGNGDETRDFTYAPDTVNCLYLACLSEYKKGEVFNSGTGVDTRIIDLVNIIKEITNSTSTIVFKDRRDWDHVSKRKSDVKKSFEGLGYKPAFDIRSGLEQTIRWYREIL